MESFLMTREAPLFIVLNVSSGHGDATIAQETICNVLDNAGQSYQLFVVDNPKRLKIMVREAKDAASAKNGVLVAAGGDGTINIVAQAAVDEGLPFGVLPQGTFNYFSRAHHIPSDTAEATKALLTATLKPVQVGLINNHIFLVNASFGLYPKLLEDREAYKAQFGRTRLVAMAAGLITLLKENRKWTIEIEYEGKVQTKHALTLLAGNNMLQLEQIGIPEAKQIENGKLVAIAVSPVKTWAMLGLLFRSALGELGESKNISSFAFEHMKIKPRFNYGFDYIKAAVDGEIIQLKTPLKFSVSPKPLRLLIPSQ